MGLWSSTHKKKGLEKNTSWEEEGINVLCQLIDQWVTDSLGGGIDSRKEIDRWLLHSRNFTRVSFSHFDNFMQILSGEFDRDLIGSVRNFAELRVVDNWLTTFFAEIWSVPFVRGWIEWNTLFFFSCDQFLCEMSFCVRYLKHRDQWGFRN